MPVASAFVPQALGLSEHKRARRWSGVGLSFPSAPNLRHTRGFVCGFAWEPRFPSATFELGGRLRQQAAAHEVLVGLPGRLAPLGDRPHDEGGAPLRVARDEETGLLRGEAAVRRRDGTPVCLAEP